MNKQPVLIFTTADSKRTAKKIATALINQQLAACVQIQSSCESIFTWEDKVQTATEFPVHIKTTKNQVLKVTKLIKEIHPYELPEIIVLDITAGLSKYLNWIKSESNK